MMAASTAASDPYVRVLSELGNRFPAPRAICLVSAHWYSRGKYVSVSEFPETIYDFQGFPRELYSMRYDAPGFPEGADILREIMPGTEWKSVERGIDHGGWTVLKHVYPDANIPVFSISMDATETPERHFEIGKALGKLRERGIMVLGSGNIVHNLYEIEFESAAGFGSEKGKLFDSAVASAIETRDYRLLFDPLSLPGGRYSVPTWEHCLPLITVLGAAGETEKPEWIYEGFEYGSISRRAVGFFS